MTTLQYIINLFNLVFILNSLACETLDTEKPGALVPPTTDQDVYLPQLAVNVAGHNRKIHLQTFGNPENPKIFVLHGGPGADFRLLLPIRELADRFFVVMWDSRGAGLSERVTEAELTINSFNEELDEVKSALSPDQKVTLIGHSFGGNVIIRYAAKFPENVRQLILIEPGKFDLSLNKKNTGGAVSFLDGQDFFWQNEILTSMDHAAADYKAVEVLPKSSRNWTCDDSIIENYPFWRFGTFHYYILQKNTRKLAKDFNWASGIDQFDGPITIIAGDCGGLGKDFQTKTNLLTLPQATFKVIEGAGHITMFTEYATETVSAVRTALP